MPRRISAWVLVVLASILIPVSVISVWAIRTVTNTDKYVETMAPLARNPVIIQGLATRATDALFSTNVVKDKVTEALPKSAKPLVAPIVNEVKTYVQGLALKVFESPKFGQLWDSLNRHSHDAVINILTGKQTPLQKKLAKGGQIALNLSPALNNVISDANAHGVTLFNPIKTVTPGAELHRRVEAAGLEVLGAVQLDRQAQVDHPGRRPRAGDPGRGAGHGAP